MARPGTNRNLACRRPAREKKGEKGSEDGNNAGSARMRLCLPGGYLASVGEEQTGRRQGHSTTLTGLCCPMREVACSSTSPPPPRPISCSLRAVRSDPLREAREKKTRAPRERPKKRDAASVPSSDASVRERSSRLEPAQSDSPPLLDYVGTLRGRLQLAQVASFVRTLLIRFLRERWPTRAPLRGPVNQRPNPSQKCSSRAHWQGKGRRRRTPKRETRSLCERNVTGGASPDYRRRACGSLCSSSSRLRIPSGFPMEDEPGTTLLSSSRRLRYPRHAVQQQEAPRPVPRVPPARGPVSDVRATTRSTTTRRTNGPALQVRDQARRTVVMASTESTSRGPSSWLAHLPPLSIPTPPPRSPTPSAPTHSLQLPSAAAPPFPHAADPRAAASPSLAESHHAIL